MIKCKTLFALGVILSFLTLTLAPATASQNYSLAEREQTAITRLGEQIEELAQDVPDYDTFLSRLKDLLQERLTTEFPVLKLIISRLINWITGQSGFYIGGTNVGDIVDKLFNRGKSSEKFIISYGSYKLRRANKENEIRLSKPGITLTYYSDKAKILKGRTTIVERPINVKKTLGPQVLLTRGFRGLYMDIESRLTGLSYKFMLGRVSSVRVLDLTPFK